MGCVSSVPVQPKQEGDKASATSGSPAKQSKQIAARSRPGSAAPSQDSSMAPPSRHPPAAGKAAEDGSIKAQRPEPGAKSKTTRARRLSYVRAESPGVRGDDRRCGPLCRRPPRERGG